MTKNKTALLVLGGVLALLVILLVVLRQTETPPAEIAGEQDYTLTPVYRLTEPVRSIAVAQGGESYTLLSLSKDAAELEENPTSTLTGLEDMPLDTAKINSVLKYAASLDYIELLFEEAEDYAPFGLAQPRARVTVTAMDGEAVTLLVGDVAVAGDGVYLQLEGASAIYLVPVYLLDHYLLGAADYLSKTVTPIVASPAVDKVVLGGSLRSETGSIILEQSEEGYVLTSPISHKAGQGAINLINSLFSLQAGGVAAIEPTSFDLNAVGLEDPYVTVEVTEKSESFTLHFSRPDSAGTLYFYREGVPLLYTGILSDYAWIEATYPELLETTAHAPALSDITSVTVDADGEVYIFAISGNDSELEIRHGDTLLDRENFGYFYQTLTMAGIEEITSEIPDAETFPSMVFLYGHRDGSSHRVAFYKGPARRYFLQVDGGEYFLTSSLYVDKVLADLPKIVRNEAVGPWAG